MSWYAVYDAASGVAVSFTTVLPDQLPAGLDATPVPDPSPDTVWDAASRSLVTYTPAPPDPAGGLYEAPLAGAWQWIYAVGPYRLVASALGLRTMKPSDATAQAYIRAAAPAADVQNAVVYAASRRDALLTALTAAGVTPSTSSAYNEAEAVLAFLGGCLS